MRCNNAACPNRPPNADEPDCEVAVEAEIPLEDKERPIGGGDSCGIGDEEHDDEDADVIAQRILRDVNNDNEVGAVHEKGLSVPLTYGLFPNPKIST